MEDLENITFKQFVDKCEVLKAQYQENLAPFFDAKMVKVWRKMIYSLSIETWQKDRIWEVLNDDFSVEELKLLDRRLNERSNKTHGK